MRLQVAFLALSFAGSCATAAGPPLAGTGGAVASSSSGGFVTSSSVSTSGGGGGEPGFIDEAGPPVDAGACSPFAEIYPPACLACLAASCCPEGLACFASSDCFGLASCEENCPSGAVDAGNGCLAECEMNYPNSGPQYGQMTACLAANCASPCATP